jgi:TIR domain
MGRTPANALAPWTDQRASGTVFISYSRKNTDFADRIEAALKAHGFEVFIDRNEITALEEWWKRIETLITQADTIVFILSPDSLASTYAQREISFATSLNKRFAPIVYRRVDGQPVPEVLAKINYIFFDDEAKFEASADRLAQALRIDITWIRLHTEFGRAARQWSVANRPNGLLLRSPLLEQAERWLGARPEGAPVPTEETRTFIQDSRAATTRRRNILTVSLIFGLVLAFGLSGYAFYQRSQVQRELDRVNTALAAAISNSLTFAATPTAILPFTTRARQALWTLAVADQSVKSHFVLAMANNHGELLRFGPGFIQLSRALGLLWPSSTEAGILFDSAIEG